MMRMMVSLVRKMSLNCSCVSINKRMCKVDSASACRSWSKRCAGGCGLSALLQVARIDETCG